MSHRFRRIGGPPTLRTLISEIQEKVVRKQSANDRRTRIVELTDKERRIAALYFEKHAQDLAELMSVLSETEKEQVYESLKKLGLWPRNLATA